MVGEFEVQEAVVLEERNLYALVGEMLQGTARAGMYAGLEGGEEAFEERVHGIDFIDPGTDESEGSRPALTFSYSDADELERWRAVDWSGRRLQLSWRRDGRHSASPAER